MDAQRIQPFLVRVRLASQQFQGCRNANGEPKRLFHLPKAALNFDYGKLTLKSSVQASSRSGKSVREIHLSVTAGTASPQRNFPLDSFQGLTGLWLDRLVNIDRFCQNSWFLWLVGGIR
jgi:hypothetical protein